MRKIFIFIFLAAAAVPDSFAQTNTSDYLTITTYYPSPYGVYGTLRLYPRIRKMNCNEGEIVYHYDPSKPFTKGLYYCNQTSPSNWVQIAGSSGVPDPLVVSRVVIGDVNNDGLFDAADIPPNSRPLYVQNQVSPSLFIAAFVNDLNYGVAVGPPGGYTAGAIQSNRFQNGGGMTPVAADLAINPLGGNVGIGTTVPTQRLQVIGNITSGNTTANQKLVAVGEENLRIVRGSVDWNGNILRGSGFTCRHVSTGDYRITFNSPFSGVPSVVATVNSDDENIVSVENPMTTRVDIHMYCTGAPGEQDDGFDFIAVGPR